MADRCLLGWWCGLCWSRRIELRGVRPLTPDEWRKVFNRSVNNRYRERI